MERAEKFRKRLEKQAAMVNARPTDVSAAMLSFAIADGESLFSATVEPHARSENRERMSGGIMWEISLRDNWTRYVPVGNMFSGLYCPIKEQGVKASGYHTVR
eukprot:8923714-Pyramimonas_sp.AAC.1